MKSRIFHIATIVSAPVAAATDSGHCDSKPFTLKKPAAAQPQPAPAVAPKPKPTESSPRTAHAGKSKYVIGCKQAKN
jgi:hypothetical protein